MHLVSRGAATTANISASGLYTRPYRVFTAVGGVSKKARKVLHHHGDNSRDNTTCLSVLVPARIWRIRTHEGHAVRDADKRWIVCGGTDSVTLETSGWLSQGSRHFSAGRPFETPSHCKTLAATKEYKTTHNSQCEFGNPSWRQK